MEREIGLLIYTIPIRSIAFTPLIKLTVFKLVNKFSFKFKNLENGYFDILYIILYILYILMIYYLAGYFEL